MKHPPLPVLALVLASAVFSHADQPLPRSLSDGASPQAIAGSSLSNDSLPASEPLTVNPGPAVDSVGTYENFNRFLAVPELSAILLGGLGLLALLRRRN